MIEFLELIQAGINSVLSNVLLIEEELSWQISDLSIIFIDDTDSFAST